MKKAFDSTSDTVNPPTSITLHQSVEQVYKLALNHHQAGQLKEAKELYCAVLAVQPGHPDANHNLGVLAITNLQPSAGLEHFRLALVGDTAREQFWLSYVEALMIAGEEDVARKMLALGQRNGLKGQSVERLLERIGVEGMTVSKFASYTKSGSYNKSLSGTIDSPTEKEIRKATKLLAQGRISKLKDIAISFINRFPNHGFGWKLLGSIYFANNDIIESLRCMKKAVELMPDDAEALSNLAVTLFTLGNLNEAEFYIRCAIEIQPDSHQITINLGKILSLQGNIDECLKVYRHALSLEPNNAETYSALLFHISLDLNTEAQDIFAEHLAFGEKFETPLRAAWPHHQNTKEPERPLKVGIVSGDLYNHAVASFLLPIIIKLAKSKNITLYAYYTNDIQDNVTQNLRNNFSDWNMVKNISDDELAIKIRSHRIDILFDLSGHTAYNRLLTFARKPAPIQISWIGYPGTTGLKGMDYYLTDIFENPITFDSQFTEKLVRMPAQGVFSPYENSPEISPLPAATNGYITFGSFNRANKINDSTIALWATVLHAIPDAKMILAGLSVESHASIIRLFNNYDINPNRLKILPRTDMFEYLNLHHQVDICLDTYPYSGGTTTYHAGWMGVPTLTLASEVVASRSSASIMGRWGLTEFINYTIEDYVAKSIFMNSNINQLENIRRTMRDQFKASKSGNANLMCEDLELVLRAMWQHWCEDLSPEIFDFSFGN